MTSLAATCCALLGVGFASMRWLRVAQREHYHPGWVPTFAFRWWVRSGLANIALLWGGLVTALIAGITSDRAVGVPFAAASALMLGGVGPLGLGLKGRTSTLVFTARLRRVVAVQVVLIAVLCASAFVLADAAAQAALASLIFTPVLIDVALRLLRPYEARKSRPFVARASDRLARVDPVRVGVAGSFGKTSTKGYLVHLVDGTRRCIASPASYNNELGLARAVNEHLTDDVEVFVAEMGVYGRGEIAQMASWIEPTIGVLVSIGPEHLERMHDLDTVEAAEGEIFDEPVVVAVVNGDDERVMRQVALRPHCRVVRCSTVDVSADVCVRAAATGWDVLVASTSITVLAELPGAAINIACAIGAALELGVPTDDIAERLHDLPVAPHRRTVGIGASGATVIDDTYNANPIGAAAALEHVTRLAAADKRAILVTPGMVELGSLQAPENERLGRSASAMCTHVLIVGRTNRAALLRGAKRGEAEVLTFDTREQAVSWVREHAAAGDVVLYENDLPDHYP